jgi:hypothetical protein
MAGRVCRLVVGVVAWGRTFRGLLEGESYALF